MSSAFICPPCPCPYCAPSLLLLVAAVISLPCAQHLHLLRCLVLVLLRLWLLSCLSLSSVLPRLLLKGSTRAACLRLPCVCIASALPEPCLCLALPLPCLCPAFVSQCVSHVIILPLCCRCLSYLAPREATGSHGKQGKLREPLGYHGKLCETMEEATGNHSARNKLTNRNQKTKEQRTIYFAMD